MSAQGERVSIRTQVGREFRDYLGTLIGVDCVLKKDGSKHHFNPAHVILWKLLPTRGTGIWLPDLLSGQQCELTARIGNRIHILICGQLADEQAQDFTKLCQKLGGAGFSVIIAESASGDARDCHAAAARELDARVDLHYGTATEKFAAHYELFQALNDEGERYAISYLWAQSH
jgi:hypothetical protein